MAEKDKASKAAVVVSVGAAIAAAFALLQKRAQAAPLPPGQIVSLDEATMNLLIAIAQASGNIDSNTLDALAKLQEIIDKIGAGVPSGQGWPPNADRMTAIRVPCIVVNTPYQLPDIMVPDDMQLLLLAWPLNPGWVFVGPTASECTNLNLSYPLPPGATVAYRVKNANSIWVSANAVPAWLVATSEQRRG